MELTPAALAKFMADGGAEMQPIDPDRPFRLTARFADRGYGVLLHGMIEHKQARDFADIATFYCGFRVGSIPVQFANDWNAKSYFGRAFVDYEGDIVYEADFFATGATEEYVRAFIARWHAQIKAL